MTPEANLARAIEELRIEGQRQRGLFERSLRAARASVAPPELMKVDEVAELMGISRRQLDRLRRNPPPGFPAEMNLATKQAPPGAPDRRRQPRFWRSDVIAFIGSLAA